jgi:uncharacterized RDD family membrane protein YckC
MLDSYLPPVPDDAVPTGERGELGPRLIATLIDMVPSIVVAIPFVILSLIPLLGCIIALVHLVVQVLYFWWFIPHCVSKNGASIGKKMQKLRVVPLGNPSGRLDMGAAVLRQIGAALGIINLIVLVVKGDERISLADMLGKSEVIKVDR